MAAGLQATAEAKRNARNGSMDKMNKTTDRHTRNAGYIPVCRALVLAVMLAVNPGQQKAMAAPVNGSPIISFFKNLRPKKYRLEISGDDANRKITIKAKRVNGLQLYLFNLEGQLVWQRNVDAPGTECRITVERGQYLYELFDHDERIDKGRLAIK